MGEARKVLDQITEAFFNQDYAAVRRRPRNKGQDHTIVGTAGFEPATSASRTLRATKLRYVPTAGCEAGTEHDCTSGGRQPTRTEPRIP